MAQRYCQKAIELDNENVKVLELTGHVMMEVGDMDAAKQASIKYLHPKTCWNCFH